MKDNINDNSINIENEIMFKIEGEAGRFNTIPWDMLKNIGDSLQELIKSLAVTSIGLEEPIDVENFKIEFSGFFQGSAVPAFKLTPRLQTIIGDVEKQRRKVSDAFNDLMDISDSGNYLAIGERYETVAVSSHISDKLYKFVNSFGSSPVQVVRRSGSGFKDIYKIKRFHNDARIVAPDNSVLEIRSTVLAAEETGIAKVVKKPGRGKSAKIVEFYRNKSAMLSYSPDIIVSAQRIYSLYSPLPSKLSKEDEYVMIENEMLGIVATGKTEEDAEEDFAQEFDFIYQRYNELADNEMTARIKRIKTLLNTIVKEVTPV